MSNLLFRGRIDGRKAVLLVRDGIKTATYRQLTPAHRVYFLPRSVPRKRDVIDCICGPTGLVQWQVGEVYDVKEANGQPRRCRVRIEGIQVTTPAGYGEELLIKEGFLKEHRKPRPAADVAYNRLARFTQVLMQFYPNCRDIEHKCGIVLHFRKLKRGE